MVHKKTLLFLMALLFCCSLAYAGELTAQDAVNYYNEGVKAQRADNFQAADTAYQKVMLLAPADPRFKKFIINNYGLMFVKQGNLAQAEENFKEVLAMDPDYVPAQLNLGLIYEKRKTRLESLEYWVKLFNLEQLKPKAYVMQGEEELQKKQ